MTAKIVRPLDLGTIRLAEGGHDDPGDVDTPPEMCLMEAAAWMAGESWTDEPQCVSPVLGAYGRRLNDVLPDGRRQLLVPLIPQMLGTAGDGLDEVRSYMALDWLIRTYTPAWLELAGLGEQARSLRDLRRIADMAAAQAAGPVVREASERAAAARAAAGAAAGDAARAAAGDAAGDAARAAAGDAAGDAARAAARAALQSTVDQLQQSAIDLFIAMICPTPVSGTSFPRATESSKDVRTMSVMRCDGVI